MALGRRARNPTENMVWNYCHIHWRH